MSLKSKLKRLENRLGIERCPHCCGILPSHVEEERDHENMTNEERGAIIARCIADMYGREELLELLAFLRPSRWGEARGTYPPSDGCAATPARWSGPP
jgi:hypothetical protein